jgi:multidrug efflux pump subunit AcrA (membrane-fusion protein)
MPKTAEELAAEAAAAEAAINETGDEDEDEDEDDYDKERALKTIKAQRRSEAKLKADLAKAREAEVELAAIKQAQADADKSASEKLTERDARIAALEAQISETAVKADFREEATERGIVDLGLAYLAAKEQGLLGKANPKTGEVEGHNFDKLVELYPALAGEASGDGTHGDAGVRGTRGKTGTVGTQFNAAVRGAIRR